MKLIFCPSCHDVRKLRSETSVVCKCGKSGGWYKSDGLHACITGLAVPVGFANGSFSRALNNRPKEGWGERFEAFVIPEECPTIEVIE